MGERLEVARDGLTVRPLAEGERRRFDELLDAHHWLGGRLVGETVRHVAVDGGGRWLALVGYGSAALSCRPRDAFVGWTAERQYRRLRYVAGNQRFCVLPEGRRPNVASAVLARSLRRLSGDYRVRWGHPVLVVETFVDPARHQGTCYDAAGFRRLGPTLGYGRVGGRYHYHGRTKVCLVRPLRPDAARILAAPFDHPLLTSAERSEPKLDLNKVALDGPAGLLERLATITDHRARRGVRHPLASVLAVAACATLSGARSLAAIGEWAAEAGQDVLARLGAKHHPQQQRYVAPHDATIRRAVAAVDAEALDRVIGGWLADQVKAGRIDNDQVAVAVDGKALRGARGGDGRPLHLFAALTHGDGTVVAQRQVDAKTNEIPELRPLLQGVSLEGAVVTGDALHAQRDHARYLVEERGADYLFTVKGNQPCMLDALEDPSRHYGAFPPSHRD